MADSQEIAISNPLVKIQWGRIALVSSGLTHIQRGYETFIRDLYDALAEPDAVMGEVHLLQGSGPEDPPRRLTVPTMTRNGDMMRAIGPKTETERYRWEQLSMATGGLLKGYWQRFDVLHFCDPSLGGALLRMRKHLNLRYKLIFANCGPMNPEDCLRFDHVQEFTPQFRQAGLDAGIAEDASTLIPMGVWPDRFQSVQPRRAVRQMWGLPRDRFMILSVASLDEPFKRVQHLIESVAALDDPDIFLLLVGQNQKTQHALETIALAEAKLPGRYRQLTVPYEQIPDMYEARDCFVLASLQEGFGKVYLEAMAANVPMLCHDCPNTQWIVGDMRARIDMESPEALTAAIRRLKYNPELAKSIAYTNLAWVHTHFHWHALKSRYLDMYKDVLGLPDEH